MRACYEWQCPACAGILRAPSEDAMYQAVGTHIREHEDAAETRFWNRLMIPRPKKELLTDEDREFLAELRVKIDE